MVRVDAERERAWASDLCLGLDIRDGADNMTSRLTSALRAAVREGRLTTGTKLPPSRLLAAELSCSRSVVVNAYELLGVEGYVSSHQGSGTFVTWRPDANCGANVVEPAMPRYNFLAGVSDLSSFPRKDWEKAVSHVMATATRADFYYSTPGGNLTFRRTLAERLSRVRGVTATAADIHACAGTVQAVSLLAHALRRSGATVIGLEEPAWSKLRPPLEAPGLTIRPLSVDREGLVVHELHSGSPVDAVMVTPAHQFPTGAVMSPRRRSALLDWARDRDVLIIEDDYDAEYDVGRHVTMALQHAAPERVVYLGTTSKILSPALRLGWMVTPPWLARKLDEMRPGFDLGISVIDQLVFAHVISSGILDRHLRSVRVRLHKRRERLVAELGRQIPDAVVHSAPAGLHVRVEFPDGCDEDRIVAEAVRRSVTVRSYRSFYGGRPPLGLRPTIVLGYADLTEVQIADGVGLIAESWRAASWAARAGGNRRPAGQAK